MPNMALWLPLLTQENRSSYPENRFGDTSISIIPRGMRLLNNTSMACGPRTSFSFPAGREPRGGHSPRLVSRRNLASDPFHLMSFLSPPQGRNFNFTIQMTSSFRLTSGGDQRSRPCPTDCLLPEIVHGSKRYSCSITSSGEDTATRRTAYTLHTASLHICSPVSPQSEHAFSGYFGERE